uniref:Uncharacterized protein n=1 Tax=Virgibacillus oceani TaxID=1479511 RepID=A0A917GZI8_9BACI|nr:hypothetical protein [Virgibacillus oceani]GGG62896.1 hypothetical protein GCM10011398_02840 [Virgibacillus oceani]
MLETEYDKQSKTYKFNIKAEVTYHEPNGDLGWLYRDKDKKNYTRTRMLTVVYDGKSDKWQLDKNELYYHVVTDNEEIVFNLE